MKIVEQVSTLLQEHCMENGIHAQLHAFDDPCAIKDYDSYDIAFLDIDMEKLNGINLARKLRQENPGIVIIFLTNFIQYAPEGFEVQAFRYLMKGDMNKKLRTYLEDAIKEVIRQRQVLTISVNAELIDVPVSQILYLESNLRVITMHLINNDRKEYRFYGNMTDLAEKLNNLGFLRVQKSFLVNMEYIEQLQYEKVRLFGGIVLPSSAKNHKELKHYYLKWRGKIDGRFLEFPLYSD